MKILFIMRVMFISVMTIVISSLQLGAPAATTDGYESSLIQLEKTAHAKELDHAEIMEVRESPAIRYFTYTPVKPIEPKTGFPRKLTESEMECLALNVYHEARGEGFVGQEAVAYTTLNRSLSVREYGQSDHICDIIKRRRAFSWLNSGFKAPQDAVAYDKAYEVSLHVVKTYNFYNSPIADATHYVNKAKATDRNRWWESAAMKELGVIGSHTFYKYRGEFVAMTGI